MRGNDTVHLIIGESLAARVVDIVCNSHHIAIVSHAYAEIISEIEHVAEVRSVGTGSRRGPGTFGGNPAGLQALVVIERGNQIGPVLVPSANALG